MTDLCSLSAVELGQLYRARAVSPVEVVSAILSRIGTYNSALNAYISVHEEAALRAAATAETQFRAGLDLGPMQGVPISAKDIIRVQGTVTSAASDVLRGAPPDAEDATCVQRLRRQGAVFIGKTNLHEFAFGAPGPSSRFGLVQNPRRLGHQAGGSSSGSAAAVAAGMGPLSLGTDTGGSIRFPASLCGIAGLKPTEGLVPTQGVIPLSTRFDQVGPMGRCVADVAACFYALSDLLPVKPSIKGLKVGLPANTLFRTPQAAANVQASAQTCLQQAGLDLVPLHLPLIELVRENWEVVTRVELWEHHGPALARGAPYGPHFRERAQAGADTSAVRYAEALRVLGRVRQEWASLFGRLDLVLLPGNLVGAPPHGIDAVAVEGETLPVVAACSPYNRVASVTGLPALTLPAGEDKDGLPLAVQIVGAPRSEAVLFAVGDVLERTFGDAVKQWSIEPRPSPDSNSKLGRATAAQVV